MSEHQTTDIAQAVLDRLGPDADPRFRQIIGAVVRRDSLIVPFERHARGNAPDGRAMDGSFHTAADDFALAPAA
jgi:hypothetical protein